jgi:hypothetical protein
VTLRILYRSSSRADIVDLRIGAALGERRSRALEDPLAIAASIGAAGALFLR